MMNFDTTNKTDRVLSASLLCFKQYGFKRTSMLDIAKAADMSRPALYILFKNKTDIFRSLSERFQKFTLENTKTALAQSANIQSRLTNAILARISPFYLLAHNSLHGPELFDLTKSTAADINESANKEFFTLIQAALDMAISEKEIDAKNNNVNSTELTQILISGASGLKETATDLPHYETLLSKMIAAFYTGLQPRHRNTTDKHEDMI